MLIFILALAALSLPFTALADDASPTLAPIVREGTPADILIEDPVLPVSQGQVGLADGSGGAQHSMTDDVPLSMLDSDRPGAYAQFRGLGANAEDNNVQALGIPLNGAQGSGFDFSVFPQFMWSSYRLQLGPAMGALDQRAISGSVTLVPWTEQALVDGHKAERGTILAATSNLGQASAAVTDGERYAFLMGYSGGDLQGPSGEASARFALGKSDVRLHLLFSDVLASGKTFDPADPALTQTTIRTIPVAQVDTPVGGGELKQSVFYDNDYYSSVDPVFGASQTRAYQFGTENVYLNGQWKAGLSGRWTDYSGNGFGPVGEGVASGQLTRLIPLGDTVVEPTLQAIGVSTYGFHPQGSLGARTELAAGHWAIFERVSYNRRFPTLNDRFFGIPGYYVANPDLGVETDWSGTLGAEWKHDRVRTSLQAYAQFRNDAQVYSAVPGGLYEVLNVGNASILSLIHDFTYRPLAHLELRNSVSLSDSRIQSTGLRILYLPDFIDVASVGWVDSIVEAKLVARVLTDSEGGIGTSATIPGYAVFDLEVDSSAGKNWSLSARLDDFTNNQADVVPGTPLPGIVLSFLVQGRM